MGYVMPAGPGRGAGTKPSLTSDKFYHVNIMCNNDTCSLLDIRDGESEEAIKRTDPDEMLVLNIYIYKIQTPTSTQLRSMSAFKN